MHVILSLRQNQILRQLVSIVISLVGQPLATPTESLAYETSFSTKEHNSSGQHNVRTVTRSGIVNVCVCIQKKTFN